MPKLKIKLPPDIQNAPLRVRQAIMDTLATAMALPKTRDVTTKGGADEHNIWSRNSNELLADAEDEFYEWLITPATERMADLFAALDLSIDDVKMEKAFTPEFDAYMDELRKAKGGGRKNPKRMISELIKISKERREKFLKYIQDANPLKKEQLQKLDKLLRSRLPEYAQKTIEAFQVRAALIGKINNQADKEFFSTVGAYVDRFPETLRAATREHTVLTIPEKRKAEAEGRKVTILPLTPLEARAVEHGIQSAANKITEVNERHINGIREMVVRAKKERWSPQKLAQELYDLYGDQNRDWRRVAITELAMVTNDAYLSGVEEGETVIGMGAENACKYCKNLIIGKQFKVLPEPPKELTYELEEKYVWPGKTNFGRTPATYIPAAPLHPNCRCRWHRVSRFYKVGEDGKLVLKTTAELIQEERARLGLPPDPNLKT